MWSMATALDNVASEIDFITKEIFHKDERITGKAPYEILTAVVFITSYNICRTPNSTTNPHRNHPSKRSQQHEQ